MSGTKANKSNKKVYNFNSMRPALVMAHNAGNSKAIDNTLMQCAGVDVDWLRAWKEDVRALRKVVIDYVVSKKQSRYDDTIIPAVLEAKRNAIFPQWKMCLGNAEKDKFFRELHVQEHDVEDLIGFAWDFMGTDRGTVEICTTEQIFRKKVESLIGCAIAKNEILSDEDRDILSKVYSARKSIGNHEEAKDEIDVSIKALNDMKVGAETDEFKGYIDRMIRMKEDEKASHDTAIGTATATLEKYGSKASEIEARLKIAK